MVSVLDIVELIHNAADFIRELVARLFEVIMVLDASADAFYQASPMFIDQQAPLGEGLDGLPTCGEFAPLAARDLVKIDMQRALGSDSWVELAQRAAALRGSANVQIWI